MCGFSLRIAKKIFNEPAFSIDVFSQSAVGENAFLRWAQVKPR
jgi:hypothetical protein